MARSSTSYPRKWNSGKTTVIRVPEKMADQLLDIAHRWDNFGRMEINEDEDGFYLQFSTPPKVKYNQSKPINIASVPHRSPFRYPGGKTWFVPYVRDWLESKPEKPTRFIEPFAGGAISSMTVAFERLAKHVIFAEKDQDVAVVWKVILNGHADWLADEIIKFEVSLENVRTILDAKPRKLPARAFQTIIKNRMQRGGIMAPGAGLIKTGENGKGLTSRWYPATLAKRIKEINFLKDRLTFIEGDAFKIIEEYQPDQDSVFYIDPPYTKAAKRLYSAWEVDHEKLFQLLSECKGDFLMSYDNTPEIQDLASKYSLSYKAIPMKNTHHAKMTELIIGRNLAWLPFR